MTTAREEAEQSNRRRKQTLEWLAGALAKDRLKAGLCVWCGSPNGDPACCCWNDGGDCVNKRLPKTIEQRVGPKLCTECPHRTDQPENMLVSSQEILWHQFPQNKSTGFVLGLQRAFPGDQGVLFLRDQDSNRPGSLLADSSGLRLVVALANSIGERKVPGLTSPSDDPGIATTYLEDNS